MVSAAVLDVRAHVGDVQALLPAADEHLRRREGAEQRGAGAWVSGTGLACQPILAPTARHARACLCTAAGTTHPLPLLHGCSPLPHAECCTPPARSPAGPPAPPHLQLLLVEHAHPLRLDELVQAPAQHTREQALVLGGRAAQSRDLHSLFPRLPTPPSPHSSDLHAANGVACHKSLAGLLPPRLHLRKAAVGSRICWFSR